MWARAPLKKKMKKVRKEANVTYLNYCVAFLFKRLSKMTQISR
jgi:hypothetical protein